MKLFEESSKPQDAAALISALFREFKDVPQEERSHCISPSGLGCQVACAWKLRGAPVTPAKESFQSRCFAENGEDRHKRIQAFLSQTPYWVDVEEYVKRKKLNIEVVAHDDYEVLLYSPEYEARFKCDGMLFIEGNYYILEIKTERQEANSVRTAADDKHQKQGITYTMILDTDRILWVYEGRNYLEQKPFVQLVTKEDKKSMSKYIKDILKYRDTPEKLMKDEKACGGCDYKNYCKMYFKELKRKEILQCQK